MPKIEKFCANGVFDPPTYSQGIKVSDAQTVLFLAGQVAYDKDGSVAHRGAFKAQAREALRCVKALVETAGGRMDSIVKLNPHLTDVEAGARGRGRTEYTEASVRPHAFWLKSTCTRSRGRISLR